MQNSTNDDMQVQNASKIVFLKVKRTIPFLKIPITNKKFARSSYKNKPQQTNKTLHNT
jgi:hypothetical protein